MVIRCYVPLFTEVCLHPLDILTPENWTLALMGIREGRYRYTSDLLALDSMKPIGHPPSWLRHCTPIRLPVFAWELRLHPDQLFCEYIIRGLRDGFRIGYCRIGHSLRRRGRNHPSSLADTNTVTSKIASELDAGRMVGPLPREVVERVHTSPIGLVPKGHSGSEWRMIVDLSSPSSASVNDGISEELCSIKYASVEDAVRLIKQLGRGTQLVKMDLRDAYRIIPVHPDDQHLLAIEWQGMTFVDKALPFGLRSAPKVFSAVADAMAWILFKRGIQFLLHYLDDFLLVGSPGSSEASMARARAEAAFKELGVPVSSHKTEGPSTRVTFLGILIDTESLTLSLPEDKLLRVRRLVQRSIARTSFTRREMESLLGHLSHAATVIRPGRLFLRPLFGLLPSAPKPFHYVRLNMSMQADLMWWDLFLRDWNGIALIPLDTAHSVEVFSDASGSFGCGAFFLEGSWFNTKWPMSWSTTDISVKELVPLVLASALWGSQWRGYQVLFHVDNMAVVKVVQKLNADNPFLCHLLRCLYFISVYYNFRITAEHIPGAENLAADALSRGNLSSFRSLFPQVLETEVSPELLDIILVQTPDWNCPRWMQRFKHCLSQGSHHQQHQPIGPVLEDTSRSAPRRDSLRSH